MDLEKCASWKWAKRKEWAYGNKCGNSPGPQCMQGELAVDRCGYETATGVRLVRCHL